MQIGVYGCGYLGTVVSACLADFGVPVTCYSDHHEAVLKLAEGNIPFHEKNLAEVARRNLRAGRLIYSTDLESFARRSHIMYIAEDSPEHLAQIASTLSRYGSPKATMVIMTPCQVGTARSIEQLLRSSGSTITVVSQPVFFTDGCAVEDFYWPDRIVLGTTSSDAVSTLKQIYRPLVMRGVPVIVTSFETAELVREAATAFLATKVSFINELASLCERVKADAVDLGVALGLDKKIAPRCLQPGVNFGGAFAEGDMESLAQLAGQNGVSLKILSAAREVNHSVCDLVVDKVSRLIESIPGKEVGILGLAFKPHTNSVAGSAALAVAERLNASGAHIRAYDPVAMPEAMRTFPSDVRFCDSAYTVAQGADAIILCTGWPEFRSLDFERIKKVVRQPVIVDTKNLLDGGRLRSLGFRYLGVGRG